MRVIIAALIVVTAGALIGARSNPTAAPQAAQGRLPLNVPFSTSVEAGDFIYLAGTLASDANGTLVAGDIRVQTKQVLDNLAKVVTGAGSDISQVASVTVYLKNVADFAAMNEVYRAYWPANPPVRTTVITNLIMPDALVEISMVALRRGVERQVIHPAGWIKSANPYSYGIKSGNTLFLAGLISRNGKDNSPIAGDMAAQTRTVLDNAGEILKAAGMSHADVVSSRVYITDTAAFQDMNTAYRAYFPANPPARATVKTGLTAPPYLVEITMTAVKDAGRTVITTPNADGTAGRANPNLSSAIRVGNRLYISGMLGNTDANKGDPAAQTRETMTRIGRTLKAAGFDWTDVVDGVVYLPAVKDFAAMNEGYRGFFTKGFPARATVEAGLVSPDGLVEIMMTAVRR
jgi:reactive intermediate/imine deaminase